MTASKKLWRNRKERKEWARRLQSEDPCLEIVHPHAAGIDVGNNAHYVAVRPIEIKNQYAGLSVLQLTCMVWLTGCKAVGQSR